MPSFSQYFPSAQDLIVVWHTYRTAILVSIGLILFSLRIALRYYEDRPREALTPPFPSSPSIIDEKLEALSNKIHSNTISKSASEVLNGSSKPPVPRDSKRDGPKRVTGVRKPKTKQSQEESGDIVLQPLIFFSSLGGATEFHARQVLDEFAQWQTKIASPQCLKPQLHDLSYIELDDYFINPPKLTDPATRYFYAILMPTYNIDSILDNFLEHLKETHNDFRIDTAPLSSLAGYSVFGFGDREGWPTEEEGFCSQAKQVDKWMAKLTARKRAFPLGMGDVKSDFKGRLREWASGVQEAMSEILAGRGLGEGIPGSGDAVESDEEDLEYDEDIVDSAVPRLKRAKADDQDLEDIGASLTSSDTGVQTSPLPIDFTVSRKRVDKIDTVQALKEMVPTTSPTYASLTKQGYTIVGSHSGVKICRWTKSALRGRGSCYKYSFYGIQSHLCMETTPSLSCSNKCVFCWRHGTNPVGTTWRWKVDPPEEIFEGVKEGHYKKIKMLKGVPGVRADRFAEAMRIRHCALSLVGEPIFYPHINEFTAMLHKEHISSFLVCNAQHPDQLQALKHVTQLYVSIDASNRESLRKIDRPLHRDFWERFQRCLDILREKRFEQRTVFRLTLVKGFNIDEEVEGYADLVAKGLPCFVEVKGVTFCGTSTSSSAGLTMANVPFYEEVATFVIALDRALAKRGLSYGIAAEHAHSCCVLLASTRFRINNKWHTRIGYEKFFRCLESGLSFGPEDYVDDDATPDWAMWGQGGFDPRDERVDRKGNKKDVELIDYNSLMRQ